MPISEAVLALVNKQKSVPHYPVLAMPAILSFLQEFMVGNSPAK